MLKFDVSKISPPLRKLMKNYIDDVLSNAGQILVFSVLKTRPFLKAVLKQKI